MMFRHLFWICVLFFSVTNTVLAQDVTDSMSETEVWLVQDALHALNYKIDPPDGQLGPQTRAAIAKYLENTNRASDGFTQEVVDSLTTIDTSGFRYAAIASATDGAYFATWNHASRQEARDAATTGCGEKTSEDCIVVSALSLNASDQGWISAVQCSTNTGDYTAVAGNFTRSAAVERAFTLASNAGYARSNCKLRISVEARGRHK